MKIKSVCVLTGVSSLLLLSSAASSRACGSSPGTININALPTLGGSVFQAYGLNPTGQVTGFSYLPGDTAAHAFLYNQGASALIDLGTLGGNVSQGFAINASGQIVGEANGTNDTFTHAFLFDGTNMADLGTLGGSFSSAAAINDAGQVVGNSDVAGDAFLRAFLWTNGVMVDLGSLGGGSSSAAAINQNGAIAGDSDTPTLDQHAFLYQNGTMLDLGTLGGPHSTAYALNDSGAVVGDSYVANLDTHGFVYSGGVMTDVGTLGGSSSTAYGINNSGQVIGASTVANGDSHGFIYSAGTITDLGTLGGNSSYARVINNLGEIVGDSTTSNNVSHAFIWEAGQMLDLNTLLPTNSDWELNSAQFINDSHTIVGIGTFHGLSEWFVLGMVPANTPPIAVATGPTQAVDCAAQVTLDGTGSSDPDGDPITFQWTTQGAVLGTNSTLLTSFPLGTNFITLRVTDSCGASSDTTLTVVVADTLPPTIACPAGQTAAADTNCQAVVPDFRSAVTVSDNCTPSNSLVITQTPPTGTVVGLGPNPVTLSATDASGNTSSCTVLFTVVDATPPLIVSAPDPVTLSAGANCQVAVPSVLGAVVASDTCTPATQLVLSQTPAAGTLVGLGDTSITVTVTDLAGNTSNTNVLLHVLDTTAPVIQTVTANPSILSPPDSRLVPVTVSVVASDNCDPAPVSTIVSVTSNQPTATGDIQITGPLSVQLAASNSSFTATRLYTINVQCADASGNIANASVQVSVPPGTRHGHDGNGDDDDQGDDD